MQNCKTCQKRTIVTMAKKSVLFICLGNICRSPISETVLRHLVAEQGKTDEWYIDSAGIGPWHVGKGPHEQAVAVLATNGLKSDHTCRQVKKEDFTRFDVIFGMDDENMGDLNARKPKNCTAKLEMLGKYDPKKVVTVDDPYYSDRPDAFEICYEHCLRCCKSYLEAAQQ